jgi:hypothetical protein
MDAIDPGDAGALIQGATFLGIVIACIRIAVAQSDKRATVAEDREKVCTAALTASTAAMTILTTEVRKAGEDGERLLRENTRQLSGIRTSSDEILKHVRGGS